MRTPTPYLLIAMVTMGCQHGPPCEFSLDPAFSEEERAAFILAASEWSKATKGHADASFDGEWPPDPLNDHVIHRGEPGSIGEKRGMSYWHTPPAGERQPKEIVIVPDLVDAEGLPWVIAHELGHHWDLRHSRNPDDLMYGSAARQISPRDVNRFCERQGC